MQSQRELAQTVRELVHRLSGESDGLHWEQYWMHWTLQKWRRRSWRIS